MASIDDIEAGIADQNSRQSFIDDTLDDATSNQKSRPERSAEPRTPKHTTGALQHSNCAYQCKRPAYIDAVMHHACK